MVEDDFAPKSRRAIRRVKREARERRERLQAVCASRGLTSVIWRTVERDRSFGFTTATRWHGIVFSDAGELLAATRDVVPKDAGRIEDLLLAQLGVEE